MRFDLMSVTMFWQAPYIIKAKVMIGAEKRAVSKLVDLDSFLVFLVETYKEEQVRDPPPPSYTPWLRAAFPGTYRALFGNGG